MFCFFFFKQKTAYEMRISDWSSDVCSSDLIPKVGPAPGARTLDAIAVITDHIGPKHRADAAVVHRRGQEGVESAQCRPRSEEHTSELQSLMRNSYAVFCLKKTMTQVCTHNCQHQKLNVKSYSNKLSYS